MIIAATLRVVAVIASLIMNLEKDCCELKAIRLAIETAISNRHGLCKAKATLTTPIQQNHLQFQ